MTIMKQTKIGYKIKRKKKLSRQTLTHCGKYLDQNQEADFHLELVQSAKWRSEKGTKGKRWANQERQFVLHLPIQKYDKTFMGMKKSCSPFNTKNLHTW